MHEHFHKTWTSVKKVSGLDNGLGHFILRHRDVVGYFFESFWAGHKNLIFPFHLSSLLFSALNQKFSFFRRSFTVDSNSANDSAIFIRLLPDCNQSLPGSIKKYNSVRFKVTTFLYSKFLRAFAARFITNRIHSEFGWSYCSHAKFNHRLQQFAQQVNGTQNCCLPHVN